MHVCAYVAVEYYCIYLYTYAHPVWGRGGERASVSLVCCREEFTYEDQALTDSAELKIDQQVGAAVCMWSTAVQCVQPVCADVCVQVYRVHAEEFYKEAHIGSGQFGSVHKMTHQKLPFPIAVKVCVGRGDGCVREWVYGCVVELVHEGVWRRVGA